MGVNLSPTPVNCPHPGQESPCLFRVPDLRTEFCPLPSSSGPRLQTGLARNDDSAPFPARCSEISLVSIGRYKRRKPGDRTSSHTRKGKGDRDPQIKIGTFVARAGGRKSTANVILVCSRRELGSLVAHKPQLTTEPPGASEIGVSSEACDMLVAPAIPEGFGGVGVGAHDHYILWHSNRKVSSSLPRMVTHPHLLHGAQALLLL